MYDAQQVSAWLVSNGFSADQALIPNSQGDYALILAARCSRADVLCYLLAQGVELDVIDPYGNNALWAACFADALACIDILLQAGIGIDFQNPSGATALIYSASSGKHQVVAHLLQAGANPLLTTQDDFSALDLAANRACLQLLRKQKAEA